MEFLNNRYVKLTLLTLGLAALIWIVLWFVFNLSIGLDLPNGLMVFVSVLAAGYLVYQFFSQRIY